MYLLKRFSLTSQTRKQILVMSQLLIGVLQVDTLQLGMTKEKHFYLEFITIQLFKTLLRAFDIDWWELLIFEIEIYYIHCFNSRLFFFFQVCIIET